MQPNITEDLQSLQRTVRAWYGAGITSESSHIFFKEVLKLFAGPPGGSEHLVNHAEQAGRFTNSTEKISSFIINGKIYILRKSLSLVKSLRLWEQQS